MAHQTQIDYCLGVKQRFPQYFNNIRVVDFGSLDINGSNRYLFTGCEYLGLDIGPGKNVDLVCRAHEFDHADSSYDVVISTEMFEHDKYLVLSVQNMVRVLKPGGLFLFTCAGPDRAEHGTRRTSPADSPLTTGIQDWEDYYENVTEQRIREIIPIDTIFSDYEFRLAPGWGKPAADLQFYGIKKIT